MITKRILLTGASGYLGQHLLAFWMTELESLPSITSATANDNKETTTTTINYEITALYHQSDGFPQAVEAFANSHNVKNKNVVVKVVSMDIASIQKDDEKVDFFTSQQGEGGFDVCVHAAALSSPRACQADPEKARVMNIPRGFFHQVHPSPMIVLSTDQVYDGKKDIANGCGFYKEDVDTPNALNIYGQSKLECEQFFLDKKSNAVLLRSSIILGPRAPIHDKAHDTFLHFCASRQDQETTFFVNEYRTVVSVGHVCKTISHFVNKKLASQDGKPMAQVYNMGGPVRVNRWDMAMAVFEHLGYKDPARYCVKAQQSNPTSPLDISMDSTKLQQATGIVHEPKTLQEIVEFTFPKENRKRKSNI